NGVVVPVYNCPARRFARQSPSQGNRVLMDYCAITPSDAPGSWDQFWYGDIWGSGYTWATYNGLIPRTFSAGGPVAMAKVAAQDGLSNTLMITEAWKNSSRYDSGDWHDDCGWTDGWDPDTVRSAMITPSRDSKNDPAWAGYNAGSAHPTGVQCLM